MLSLPIIEIWTQLKRQLFYADRNKSLIKFFQFRISKISKIQKINFFNYTIINNFIHFYFTFKYVFSRFQIKLIITVQNRTGLRHDSKEINTFFFFFRKKVLLCWPWYKVLMLEDRQRVQLVCLELVPTQQRERSPCKPGSNWIKLRF